MKYEELLESALEKVEKKQTKPRFEIPTVEIEVYGNKTVITNFGKISSYIRRDKKALAKYLMRNLATPGTIQGDQFILQARVQKETIQKKLNAYIKKFVLCKVCGSADTKLVKEGRVLFLKCDACGAKYPITG